MPRVVVDPLGVMVDGKLYRRDQWVAAERQTPKDWALFGMIMLGLALSAALALAGIALLAWISVEAIGAIGRQIQAWR